MIWKVKIGSEYQNRGMPRRAGARHENGQMVFQKDRMQFRERERDARDKCHMGGLNVWEESGLTIRKLKSERVTGTDNGRDRKVEKLLKKGETGGILKRASSDKRRLKENGMEIKDGKEG